ncbi:MAG: hypothetical protein A2Z78_00425 [Candidatus Nealsonbacteria bacterium RBG_13_36_15]|uniref:2-isopropylmalate synthase LeuA allosteric (dimerisation) domain-containing protein n=1 Tax=Candidatus Nealsonbacteria bacterium RBG_13_36_15 TaxID=1801660 RepID=A0A1G2DWK6_9BACT|nr:MAG: hypothetical protein A2Z78_00425 [Candidatus Nealsonbacteria bacterium RBG_13_36_15]
MSRDTRQTVKQRSAKEEAVEMPQLTLESWGLSSSRNGRNNDALFVASLRVRAGENIIEEAAEGKSLVETLVKVLEKIVKTFYPEVKRLTVIYYHIYDGERAASAAVKLAIEDQRGIRNDTSEAISFNVVDATWQTITRNLSVLLQREAS